LRKLYPLEGRSRKHWSYYFDSGDNRAEVLKPAPDQAVILSTFAAKLAGLKKVI